MGKNRKRGKGKAAPPGQGPQHGLHPAAGGPRPPPPDQCWPRPPQHGGFRGPHPGHPMGHPPGQRFPGPPRDFGPRPSRMMMMMRMDDMVDDRRFVHEPAEFMMRDEPLHPMDFSDRPGFRHPPYDDAPRFPHRPEFDDGPPPPQPRFRPPDYDRGPGFCPPEFNDRPPEFDNRNPDFCPPEFRGRPQGFHPSEFGGGPGGVCPPEYDDRPGYRMMDPRFNPMEGYGARDPNYMRPMDVPGNHTFGERGGFSGPPPDFRDPGPGPPPPETFNAPKLPPPEKQPCPPPPPKNKDQPASKETKTEPVKTMASKLSTFKNVSANTPRGRSLGVISYIGASCGFIERDDLKKYTFSFNAFFGKRVHLVPGVKVHFTVVKTLGKECAADVKVAPGGTDDIDSTLYEGVVTTVLADDNVKEDYPGRIRTILTVDPIKLPFGKTDSNVTLLLYDRVEFQLLTNLITKEQRATNIKPKAPETFQLTKETRVMGVVANKNEGTLTIMTDKHDNLTASALDSLSDTELNVMDEVELTIVTVKDTKRAIRLKKLPEGSVTFNQQAKGKDGISGVKGIMAETLDKWKPVTSEAVSQEAVDCFDVSSEKYEGTIAKTIPKNFQTQLKETGKQEPPLGLLITTLEGTEKKLSFRSADVITKATMMAGDKVQFNISTNRVTKDQCAVNLEIQPDTFQTDSEEQRKIGVVVKLEENFGFIKTQQDAQLFFNLSEVMEETKLALSEKVEFTLAQNEAAEGGNKAVRIRRLNESVFTSAPKLEAFGVKEKKKMTIKLLRDPKDLIKDEVKTKDKGSESMEVVKPNKEKDAASPSVKSMKDLKKESEIKQEKRPKDDRGRSRSRESSRRRYSRSRSREHSRRRYSRSRSRSRDRSSSHYKMYRSSSRERRESRYRRSRSRDRSERHRRSYSRSRSRERSSRSARRRSRSPVGREDRYRNESSSKDHPNKKQTKSPEETVDDELLKKRRELMELNELIARKKAIVAMEQKAKKIETVVEVDGELGFKTFDYQHVHRENMWIPDLKPTKSILKKQSELQTDPQSQAFVSQKTAPCASSENLEMEYHQSTNTLDSNTSVYSTFKSDSEKTSWTNKMPMSQDPELIKKKRQLEELSESIARKRAIIAMEQKTKGIQDVTKMEMEYEFDSLSDDRFVMSKDSLWRSDIKSDVQPKKSILKKRSEPLLSSQSDTTTIDEYQSSQVSPFTKPSTQSAAASPFERTSNPQPIHSNTLEHFNRIIQTNESSAPLALNKPVIPQSLTQASNAQSLYDKKPSSMSKANSSHGDQLRHSHDDQREPSHQTLDQPHSSKPSTSMAAASEQKGTLTTQMERFLSALNKADSSIVNSLFREARKDLALINTQKTPHLQSDRKIPFMNELYDPFKEDENDQPPFMGRDVGKLSGREQDNSSVETKAHLDDPSQDDLLPHERAVQDGSGFSQIVGMKYGIDPTAKAERKNPYGDQMVLDNWNKPKEDPDCLSKQWNRYEEEVHLYETKRKHYAEDHISHMDCRRSAEYQNVNPNVHDKSLARQQSEESNEDKDEKAEQFEKLQSLLQTIGLNLDTAEVSKLADRTRERLYGKQRKLHSSSSHSFDQKRERSLSRSDQRGSRADSSDSGSFRSVSPAQSSNRKVYMSYKDTVKYRDQGDVGVELTSIKRTITNLKSTRDTQDPYTPSTDPATVSQVSYQSTSEHDLSAAQSVSAQYTPSSTAPAFSASQYSYHSNEQNYWAQGYSVDSNQTAYLQHSAYPYGTLHQSTNPLCYQGMSPQIPSPYSTYATQMASTYSVLPPVSLAPLSYGPPSISNPLLFSSAGSSYTNLQAGSQLADSKKTQPVRCLKTIETVKTPGPVSALVRIQPNLETPAKETEAKHTPEEAGIKHVAVITEDDIKAKQKKRLEQFNQRMKRKKEQQMEAQRSRGQNRNAAPGKITPNEIKNVWICGHALVFWAEKRATSPEFGMQLGMDPNSVRVWWKGVQGMKWEQLLPLLLQLKDNWPKPDVLVIHLGGNDISTTSPEVFIETVKEDLTSLKNIFPECLLVWSNILPRQFWRGTEDHEEMDEVRRAINESVKKYISELGGSALTHDNILPRLGLYRPDGVHLCGKGFDTFNLNVQDFLEKWESETNETKTETSV